METEETPHPDYVTGFNEGYIIARDMPALAEQLRKAVGESERGKGFQSGREQWHFEEKEHRRPAWLNKERLTDKDHEQPAKDIDKEDR